MQSGLHVPPFWNLIGEEAWDKSTLPFLGPNTILLRFVPAGKNFRHAGRTNSFLTFTQKALLYSYSQPVNVSVKATHMHK